MSGQTTLRANPFTPVFGKVPPYLAGRTSIIEDMLQALDAGSGDPNLCSVFTGARGTGKTALLTYLGDEARRLGWIVADVTAAPGMLDEILQCVQGAGAHLLEPEPSRKLTGVGIAPLGSVTWSNTGTSYATWRLHMNDLFSQLEATGTGILITVDELDPSLDEMTQLVTVYQHFVREGRKAALIMAGLPHRVSGLLSGRSTSFLRRAAQHKLGSIPAFEVKEAFRLTVREGGRDIGGNALERAAGEIDGFPFMFQLLGYRAWNAAAGNACITEDDIEFGARLAREELRSRVFDATFAELSKGDVSFLQAMALDDGPSARADVTQRLGRSSSYISTYKKRLLEAGVIEEPFSGTFTFALPGFRDYIRDMTA